MSDYQELISELNNSLTYFVCIEYDKLKHDLCGIPITQGAEKKAFMIQEFIDKVVEKSSQIRMIKNNLTKQEGESK